MTNTLAIILAALIWAALALDYLLYGWDGLYYLMRRMIDLIRWLAVWR